MSTHTITIAIELSQSSDQQQAAALSEIAATMVRAATSGYGVVTYDDGRPLGHGGYEGPLVVSAGRVRSG